MTLRQQRESLGIPKDAIAVRLGIDAYDISRLESGSVAASVATLARISFLLGADARELFDLHPCECGCGELVGRRFVHGHARTSGRRGWQWAERRRELGIPETKVCEGCGRAYSRRKRENTKKWLKRRWCSADCWRNSPICRTPPHQRRWGSLTDQG
jgi:transcriptional regulator with XRE-family HTH domain